MRHYSFTLTNPSGSEQLCRIGQFPDLEHVFCLAEMIASDLSIGDAGPWLGWTMEVRDCQGSLVLSVPIGHVPDAPQMADPADSEKCLSRLEVA